jgi:hypothetical protein
MDFNCRGNAAPNEQHLSLICFVSLQSQQSENAFAKIKAYFSHPVQYSIPYYRNNKLLTSPAPQNPNHACAAFQSKFQRAFLV